MAKVFLVTVCVALVGVLAEPPSSYRPPQGRNTPAGQYGPPSQQYGAPQGGNGGFGRSSSSAGRSFSYNSLAENQFSGAPRRAQSFGRQQQQPSQQYGAPSSNNFDNAIVTDAAASRFGGRSNAGGFAAHQSNHRQQPAHHNSAAPSFRSQQPGSSYAAAARQQPSAQYGAPAPVYGAPNARNKMDDDLAEPANYEFNYEVQAAEESGAEFGHQETREDDSTRGEYYVLLPDGRMQIVEYEADEEGFRPRIRYEETGYPDARDNQGPY